MEVYHPPYEFRPNRPRFTSRPPNYVPYGSVFDVGYAFDDAADIAGVVLVNAGGVSVLQACSAVLCFVQCRRDDRDW